jgi:hypothetical protein
MQAGFGWIDFSVGHRDRVFSVVELLSADGSVDELGVGVVRDAIADWLFPGVSTIQTCPKYFIIIPQIFLSYLKKFYNKEKLPVLKEYVRNEEHRIMNQLSKNYNYAENNYIIGVNVAKNGGELARKPTSIYWNGLRKHGIIATNYSFSEFVHHNDLSKYHHSGHKDENAEDEMASFDENFGIKCPDFEEIDDTSRMELTEDEAHYLKDQFISINGSVKHKGNLLSQILQSPERIKIILAANNFVQLAETLLEDSELNDDTKKILEIALDFDFLIHGAHIRYNIQLHKKAGNKAVEFEKKWDEWIENLEEIKPNIQELNFDFIFTELAPRTGPETQKFMKDWQTEVLQPQLNCETLDSLVKKQEFNKKHGKAKLISSKGEYSEWVGLNRLQYRFSQVKKIIVDINTTDAKSKK